MGNLFGGGSKQLYQSQLLQQQGLAQQAAANREAAIAGSELSMVNQNTPFGSLTYAQTGTTANNNPIYTATQTYDPDTTRALNAQKRVDYKTNELAESQADRASALLGSNADFSEGAIASKVQSMINPRLAQRFGQDEDKLRASLINRGVREGSQAFNDAMMSFNQGKNDAYSQEALSNRQQAIQEIALPRNQTLNEINALLGTQQIGQPQFVNTPRANFQPADYQGAAAQQVNALNQYYQGKQAQAGGIAGLIGQGLGTAATLFMKSDRRVKTDVHRIGELANGLPVYLFRYIGGGPMQFGLMAQDVEIVAPHAVREIGGVKHVDYVAAVNWRAA